jgi:hypothetical protein
MVAFSDFYDSHEPSPLGDARGIVPPHCDGHRNGQESGNILHLRFVCCRPGGRRGDTERVVARWRHLVAFMKAVVMLHGAMPRIASMPLHRHRNGLRRRCIRSSSPAFLLGIIIAKDHVMVH